ncbi:hypothetical protein [Nocardia sp. CA-135398]|uniref:hypothetical protein n=1 Tax=Nocardia sp. CA-135398 TaxID=3239977 RepID=UPI003D96C434
MPPGFIGDLDVYSILQGRGIATCVQACPRMLLGYLWRTSLDLPEAASFRGLVAERTACQVLNELGVRAARILVGAAG